MQEVCYYNKKLRISLGFLTFPLLQRSFAIREEPAKVRLAVDIFFMERISCCRPC